MTSRSLKSSFYISMYQYRLQDITEVIAIQALHLCSTGGSQCVLVVVLALPPAEQKVSSRLQLHYNEILGLSSYQRNVFFFGRINFQVELSGSVELERQKAELHRKLNDYSFRKKLFSEIFERLLAVIVKDISVHKDKW